MKQEKINKLLIDYVDGQLPPTQRAVVEKKIRKDKVWQEAYEQLTAVFSLIEDNPAPVPDASLKDDFAQFLAQEIRYQPQETKLRTSHTLLSFRPYLRYAAAATLLILSVVAGMLINQQFSLQDARHGNLPTLPTGRQAGQVGVPQASQFNSQPTQTLITALQQESASKRLSGILHQVHTPQTVPDQALLQALVRVLNQDDNTNVRLAALQALLPYRNEPQVYGALLQSLVTQDDALVQITLIDVMVATQQPQVREKLQQIVRNETASDMVKEEAQVGLFKL